MLFSYYITFVTLSLFLQVAHSQVQLLNVTSEAKGLSSTCVGVLNQQVTCNATLSRIGTTDKFESDKTLNGLCSTSCATSLSTWLRRIGQTCTTRHQRSDGYDVHPAYYAQVYIERYQIICLQNAAGANCHQNLRNAFKINPVNQNQTGTPASGALCTDCALRVLQTQLMMPLASSAALSSKFSTLTSSCSKPTYTITPLGTTTQWSTLRSGFTPTSTTSTAAPTSTTCLGTTYTIKSTDTCHTISKNQGISTHGLLSTNNLPAFCANFPKAGSVCITTLQKCTVYTVKQGDTCSSIATANKLTWTQVVSFNSIIDPGCTNLSKYVGHEICVSNPRGTWVNPSPQPITSTTTTKDVIFTLPFTPIKSLPTAVPFNFANETQSIANGTRLDCELLVAGEEIINPTTKAVISSCAQVAAGYNITVNDLKLWNPSLATGTCALKPKSQYCVQLLKTIPPGTTSYCLQHDVAPPGYTCGNFSIRHAITPQRLIDWNPGVLGTNCTGWQTGLNYCVAVYGFRQPGMIATCNKWDIANITDAWLNACGIIETKHGLTHGRMLAWNPRIYNNCTGLERNYAYCVSIPNFTPIYSSTTRAAKREEPTLIDAGTITRDGARAEITP